MHGEAWFRGFAVLWFCCSGVLGGEGSCRPAGNRMVTKHLTVSDAAFGSLAAAFWDLLFPPRLVSGNFAQLCFGLLHMRCRSSNVCNTAELML
jgi:hypothetical protein